MIRRGERRETVILPPLQVVSAALTRRNPHGIHIDGLELTPLAGASTPVADDDFFESWDKEKPKAATPATSATSAAPPSIGAARPSPSPAPASTGPRTVSSASLRATPLSSGGGAGAAHRPAQPSKLGGGLGGSAGGGGKLSKLGAKKATTTINFEEAQRKALEEEERVKRLGYDKAREAEEARAVKAREEEERRRAKAAGAGSEPVSRSSTPANVAGSGGKVVDDAPKVARLGFGQVVGAAPVVASKP
jgi:ADP-ribosylation factor GTPase-activating protein 2/3